MRLAFITDGNNELGLGHVYQSSTLAGYILKKTNELDSIYFLTKSEEYVVSFLEQTGCDVHKFYDDNDVFQFLANDKPDRIIFDKLDVNVELAKNIKQHLNIKMIIMTNLTKANDYADITVLADIGSNFENIVKRNNKTGQISFFGPTYWVLRSEFYNLNKKNGINLICKKILLMFGGADYCNYSTILTNELISVNNHLEITLILGSAFNNLQELDIVLKKFSKSEHSIKVLKNVSNMAEIMYNNDLVITSPGMSFFEALAVGTPVIGFHQNDLQRDVYKGFLDTYGKEDVKSIREILSNKNFIFSTHPFVQKMNIGQGINQIIQEILN
jgi:spore coat polysaccharide biosynthesis predicted glycosyltransferase SpsG